VRLTAGRNGAKGFGVRGEITAGEVESESCLSDCVKSASASFTVLFVVERRLEGMPAPEDDAIGTVKGS
jgi:hypothetical protein